MFFPKTLDRDPSPMYRFMGHKQDIYDQAFLKSYGGLIGQVAHAAVSKLLKRFEGGLWDKFAFTRYLKPFGIKFNSLMAANAQHKKHVMKVAKRGADRVLVADEQFPFLIICVTDIGPWIPSPPKYGLPAIRPVPISKDSFESVAESGRRPSGAAS